MLDGLSTLAARPWLLALLIAWGLLLFGGAVFGKPNADRSRRMPRWTRLGSSLVLGVAGWIWYGLAQGSEAQPLALPLAVGMSLCFLADTVIAGLFPIKQPVMAGMGVFALGHIAYITGMLVYGNVTGLNAPLPRWAALVAWLVAGGVAWYWLLCRGQQLRTFHKAALPYALLLSGSAGLASGIALQQPRFVTLALGTILFLISDLILAGGLIKRLRFDFLHDIVWLTYGPGQMLIVYSVGIALTL